MTAGDPTPSGAPDDTPEPDVALEPDGTPDSTPPDPFEAIVWDAVDALPEGFREHLDSVAIVIEDEPTADDLRRTGAYGLLGLYTGVPRTAYGAEHAAWPSKITIYRGPHLRQFGGGQTLVDGVGATVRHEIAHHFGISDARLTDLAAKHGSSGG